MADLADCMDALALIAESACYPNGTSAPSVTGSPIDIAQGWPMAKSLDELLKAGRSMVTVYSVPNTSSAIVTPMDTKPGVVSGPIHGLAAGEIEQGFTLRGKPYPAEYATVILNGRSSYSYASAAGDLPETVCAFLANAIQGDYPATTASGATVTIPGASSIVVRIGAPATVGKIIGRQKQQFRITAWCPTPPDRAAITSAMAVALRRNYEIDMPDTSQAFITYGAQNWSDERQNLNFYRGDNVVAVQWDTLDTYPAFEITAVNIGLSARDLTTPVVG